MNDLHVELRPIDSIHPYEKNPRLNAAAVDAVATSIEQFGWRQPLVVDGDGVVVVGHTRLLAAQKLGISQVPVHVATDLTPEQARAYRIADNQTSNLSTWDPALLPLELRDLQSMGVDLSMLGFTLDDLAGLLDPDGRAGECDPDDIPEPPDTPITQPGDLWVLGDHRLLCGDSAKTEDVDRLLDGQPIHLVNSDPPYNVKVEPRSNNAIAAGNSSFSASKKKRTHHQSFDVARQGEKRRTTTKMRAKDRPLENDFVSDEAFDAMLLAWFGNLARVLLPGRAFFVWGGYANVANYPPALKASGLYFSQSIIWHKQHPVLTRKDFMGDHEWCQPADTAVLTPDGEVPISTLRDGDRVVGYATRQHRLAGKREGQSVRRAVRPYMGEMLGVRVGRHQTWVTPEHLWTAKLVGDADRWWCVYLMRRGKWWRIGKSRLINSWGFGLKHRVYSEGADSAWILCVHRTNAEALVAEQSVAANYGIPQTVWWRNSGLKETMGDVHALYDRLDLEGMQVCAMRALADHGRSIEHPCVTSERLHEKISRRVPFRVRSCNLIPDVMVVPVPGCSGAAEWSRIEAIERTAYRGTVHSLEVEPSGHYVADGIVTHNCFYGWREGAAHQFYGPNNVPDVWSVKKVNPASMIHLTEKPVELAVRALQYSSRAGENVIDLFGGSGSTLIAAEQTQRRAFLMELDPAYCDVIVDRYQRFTGKPGVLDLTGESPIPIRMSEDIKR